MRGCRAALTAALAATAVLSTSTGRPATAAIGTAVANGSSYLVEGTNVFRGTDQLVLYVRTSSQTVSPANQWGAEAAVVNGTVTELRDRQSTGASGIPLPTGGAVLSGHGAARLWLLANAGVGQAVSYPGQGSSPAPTSSPSPTGSPAPSPVPTSPAGTTATVAGATRPVSGTDVFRGADALVVYTRASGTVSPANEWGAEAAVLDGRVTEVRDRQSTGATGTPIPVGGYVLSGHGSSRLWLLQYARTGGAASLSGSGTPTPAPTPTPTASPTPASCSAGYVRLTFDDGPDATVTPQVLDTLRARGAKATFFVLGYKTQPLPALVRRQAVEGHKVGNHTWDHPYLTQLTPDQQRSQLQRTSDAIAVAGAPRPTEWRPPYEDWNSSVRTLASSMGLSMTLWSYETDSNDWQGGSPEVIRDRVVGNAHDSAVVLMHDRIQNSATALPMILDGLARKGLCVRP